jgi:hypothetical protein
VAFSPTQQTQIGAFWAVFARIVSSLKRARKSMLVLTSAWRLQVSDLIDVKEKILVAELLKFLYIDYN